LACRAGCSARRTWRSTPRPRASLEICRTADGTVAGSLLGEIDRCVTAAGRRLLGIDLAAPLTDRGRIEDRLDLVAWFTEEPIRRDRVRSALRSLPDLGRALGRWWPDAAVRVILRTA
jgi:DNA mismatch repair protein MutS